MGGDPFPRAAHYVLRWGPACELPTAAVPLPSVTQFHRASERLIFARTPRAVLRRGGSTSSRRCICRSRSGPVSGRTDNDDVADLYTKNGRPLRRSGDKLFARSGTYVGRIKGDYVFDPSGRYAGTIAGDRVAYRSTHTARTTGPSVSANRAGSGAANRGASGMWGDEPSFPD